jgi:hypothetical protein
LTAESGRGLDLPERVRRSLAGAVAERGVQARVISTQGRESMRPPQGHIIVAAEDKHIEAVRGPSRIVRRLEFYKSFYGPVVRLALSVYPMEGEPVSVGTVLNVSQVSGDTALAGLGRQKSIFIHFYSVKGDDLTYAFSKEIPNAPEQRTEAKKVLKMARDGLAERQFELPVPEPDGEG